MKNIEKEECPQILAGVWSSSNTQRLCLVGFIMDSLREHDPLFFLMTRHQEREGYFCSIVHSPKLFWVSQWMAWYISLASLSGFHPRRSHFWLHTRSIWVLKKIRCTFQGIYIPVQGMYGCARTVWFSFHLGCHRSAVSLSALNVSPLTQTVAPVWGSDPCFSSPTCWRQVHSY